MKRVGGLFDELTSWTNLDRAAQRARRGKRYRPDVAAFEFDREYNLLRLQQQLRDGTYHPGAFRTRVIYEPKRRLISAAPYGDRVVHHALCNVIEPVFERRFIPDSYACRKGKGNHAAVRRASEFAARYRYVLKADIQKFFPTVDHAVLLELVERRIKDPRVLDLIRTIVQNPGPQEPHVLWIPGADLFTPYERTRGLPIGNQTSQFLANVMLDPLDHFIKEQLRIRGYLRYADDMLLFSDDKGQLGTGRDELRDFLAGFRLKLHPRKSEVFPVAEGIRFLGYRVFATHRILDKANVLRFRRRLRRLQRAYAAGRATAPELRARLISWMGHASHAKTFNLVRRLLKEYKFVRPRKQAEQADGTPT